MGESKRDRPARQRDAGRQRTVVGTYNPRTAAKQRYSFDKKMLELQEALFELRSKAKSGKAPWNKLSHLGQNYLHACEKLCLWSTDDIVREGFDRYMVEEAFRQSKDDDLVSALPIRRLTDRKIRCHIFANRMR